MKKLILVDALALLYRSFYAIRELSTEAGIPTNAVYGFIRKMRSMQKVCEPSHWAVAFDGGIPADRLDLLPEYKAQRPSMPHALREQIPAVEEYLDAACIARVRVDGEEADDVMASAARWAEPEADAILLASSDKDLYQLVSTKTTIFPLSGTADPMDASAVKAKTGVDPAQIVDWLAMVGDSADNINGIPGVGPKTAATLLNKYGSLDGIRKHIDEISSERLRHSLQEGWDLLTRNVEMIRLRPDIDCRWKWPDLEVRAPNHKALLTLLERLEFKTMAREIREPELF